MAGAEGEAARPAEAVGRSKKLRRLQEDTMGPKKTQPRPAEAAGHSKKLRRLRDDTMGPRKTRPRPAEAAGGSSKMLQRLEEEVACPGSRLGSCRYSQNPQIFRGIELQGSANNAPIVLMGEAILDPGFTSVHSSQQQNTQAMQAQQQQQQFSQMATTSTLRKEQPDSLILPTYSQHQGSIGLQQQVSPRRTNSLSEISGVQ